MKMLLRYGELKYEVVEPNDKKKKDILPYFTFPLTNVCNSHCLFCGEGGELTVFDDERYFDTGVLIDTSLTAIKRGVSKFRLTGGEPFLHPKIGNIMKFFSDQKTFLLVNTNARLLKKHESTFLELNDNVNVAVSLHSTHEAAYDKITGTKGQFGKVIKGIEFLKSVGNLMRLNMVITPYNTEHIDDMISYCKDLGCNLKIHEIVDVPIPFEKDRGKISVTLENVEEMLSRRSEKVLPHTYSESFGIPCRRYTVNEVTINIKSLGHGTRFDLEGICKGCNHFPCNEGLYDGYILPDGNILPCRKGEVFQGQSFDKQLEEMISIYQRAEYYERNTL